MSKPKFLGGGFAPSPNLYFAIITATLLIASACWAQAPDTLWTRYFNNGYSGDREECYDLIQTLDGGFLIGGKTYTLENDLNQYFEDYYLVKTDSNGIEEWSRKYNMSPRHDELGGMVQMPNGDIFIAGSLNNDYFTNVLKLSSEGDSIWCIQYGFGRFKGFIQSENNLLAIGLTGLPGYGGYAEHGGETDGYIIKIDQDGELIWRGVYGGGGNDSFHDIALVENGYVGVGHMGNVCDVVKINQDGEQEWFRQYNFTEDLDRFFCVTALPNGEIVAGGTVGFDEALLVKFDSAGDTVWVRRSIPGFREVIRDIIPAHGGGYILAGGTGGHGDEYDIMRVDDLGEEVWEIEVEFDNDAEFNEATSVLALEDGGYLIGGNRDIFRLGGHSAGLIRTEPDTIVLPYELELEPEQAEINFGEVDVDSSVFGELAIVNTGRRNVVIDSLSFVGDSTFTCPMERPFYISPPDTSVLPIMFQPLADSMYSANLRLWYGDESLEFELSGIGKSYNGIATDIDLPTIFALTDAYPNPFNSTTTIGYSLPAAGNVRVAVYDLSGREVARLVEDMMPAGTHKAVWVAEGVASGVYVVKLASGGLRLQEKLILIK